MGCVILMVELIEIEMEVVRQDELGVFWVESLQVVYFGDYDSDQVLD